MNKHIYKTLKSSVELKVKCIKKQQLYSEILPVQQDENKMAYGIHVHVPPFLSVSLFVFSNIFHKKNIYKL